MYTYKPEYLFTKGIAYAEFFDPATDQLLGFSEYVTDFGLKGSFNEGRIEGGPGNMLILCIPDSARLSVTAKTADSALSNMALSVGSTLEGGGIVERKTAITATGTTLSLSGAAAPYVGTNGPVCYVGTSSGSDRARVEAASGTPYRVVDGVITGFTAVAGNTYCVRYFSANTSAQKLAVDAMFTPRVVRAHFSVNCYAKKQGSSVMASALYKIRHYYFPYYCFTGALSDSLSQSKTGTVDLSGSALSYEEALAEGACGGLAAGQKYGYIVDEYVDGNATDAVEGVCFIGLGAGVTLSVGQTKSLPVKVIVAGSLTELTDPEAVTFSSSDPASARFADAHTGTVTAVAPGEAVATATVTNARTGVVYTDTVDITVEA